MDPGASLVFGVDLDIPARLEVAGRTWHARPEFHVTTFTPDALAAAVGADEQLLRRAGEQLRDELTRPRPIAFDGRVAEVRAGDGRRTLVAFCNVEGLDDVYGALDTAVGRRLPRPPAHVTVYTAQPGMEGIRLTTQGDVARRASLLAAHDAEQVVRHLRR